MNVSQWQNGTRSFVVRAATAPVCDAIQMPLVLPVA